MVQTIARGTKIPLALDDVSPVDAESASDLDVLAPEVDEEEARINFVTALTQGRTFTDDEMLALEIGAVTRRFERRRELLQNALETADVQKRLGTSRQAVHKRVNDGALLAVIEGGKYRYPLWQFDVNGPDGVVQGLPDVLRELAVPTFSKMNWLTRSNAIFEGQTPLEILKSGDVERVVQMAGAIGVT